MLNREQRLTILAGILLLALGAYLYPRFADFLSQSGPPKAANVVLPGDNEILAIKVNKVVPNLVELEVEYFYNGGNGPQAVMVADVPFTSAPSTYVQHNSPIGVAPGRAKTRLIVTRYGLESQRMQTQSVTISMRTMLEGRPLTAKRFDQVLKWPSNDPFALRSPEPADIERLYRACVEAIDRGEQLGPVKGGLEEILLANPNYVPAYAELARYSMKTNWSREGLAQAEQLLQSALRIDPRHANTLVLLGYVHTHQKRYKEAEDVLRQAEEIGTDNIWLHSNRGELYATEGRKREALAAYGKALEAPQTLQTYERAREEAYRRTLALLSADQQWKQVDELYARGAEKFPNNPCYRADHADFVLRRLGDLDRAIAIGTVAIEQGCADYARGTLGMAYFAKWTAALKAGMSTQDADQFFNRGLALNVQTSNLMYRLATSEHTSPAIAQLKRRGVSIDSADRSGRTALMLSILDANLDAARVLIAQGANVNQADDQDGFTPLMFAAARGDEKLATLLLRSGANRAAKTRSGFTAEQIAQQGGFTALARLLGVGRNT